MTIYKGMTDRSGEAFFGILTYRITGKGTYKVLAETTYSGYMTSSSNTGISNLLKIVYIVELSEIHYPTTILWEVMYF
ncbi:hypothetical protein [Clostridium beijerinckii]|uniref:hypothetical protein n=1 Tax=Clostridium beijerinckii TaxID=1520 RepID=UPI001EBBAFB8|nr:hypothetical protein [Clostridium beijerinckii]NOW34913.1 hypothetical protein [Clostridium beijerinckii]